jgi:serine/threonine protein phosphatase 1
MASWLGRLFGHNKNLIAVPDGMRVYAVGDIHGRLDLLRKLWTQIEADAQTFPLKKVVIFVGDYVDRGRDSKGVIDFLLGTKLPGGELICLRGNHDQALLDFLANAEFYRSWRPYGAPETLLSYGVSPPLFDDAAALEKARLEFAQKLPPAHLKFLQSLPYSVELGSYLFVHAGVRPGIPLSEQAPQDLLWIREDFLASRHKFEKIIVHGHTPQDVAFRHAARIGLDTGAYATGRLSAAVLEGTHHRFLAT